MLAEPSPQSWDSSFSTAWAYSNALVLSPATFLVQLSNRHNFWNIPYMYWTSLVAQMVKNLPEMQKTQVWFLGWEHSLEKGMAAHSNILAWKMLWTEEPGKLQSMALQRAGHDWVTNTRHIYLLVLFPLLGISFFPCEPDIVLPILLGPTLISPRP